MSTATTEQTTPVSDEDLDAAAKELAERLRRISPSPLGIAASALAEAIRNTKSDQ